jgi:hypothetical protein
MYGYHLCSHYGAGLLRLRSININGGTGGDVDHNCSKTWMAFNVGAVGVDQLSGKNFGTHGKGTVAEPCEDGGLL